TQLIDGKVAEVPFGTIMRHECYFVTLADTFGDQPFAEMVNGRQKIIGRIVCPFTICLSGYHDGFGVMVLIMRQYVENTGGCIHNHLSCWFITSPQYLHRDRKST